MKAKIRDIRMCKGVIGVNLDIRLEDYEVLDPRELVEIVQKKEVKK